MVFPWVTCSRKARMEAGYTYAPTAASREEDEPDTGEVVVEVVRNGHWAQTLCDRKKNCQGQLRTSTKLLFCVNLVPLSEIMRTQ